MNHQLKPKNLRKDCDEGQTTPNQGTLERTTHKKKIQEIAVIEIKAVATPIIPHQRYRVSQISPFSAKTRTTDIPMRL